MTRETTITHSHMAGKRQAKGRVLHSISGSQLWFSSNAAVEAALGLWRPVQGSALSLVHHVALNKSLSLSRPLSLHLQRGRTELADR